MIPFTRSSLNLFPLAVRIGLEGYQCFVADMVLDPFCVAACDFRVDADIDQEGFHDGVALAAFLSQFLTLLAEEDAAIGFAFNKAGLCEPVQHARDGRLCDAEIGGNIDLPCFAVGAHQIVDQFDIILKKLGTPGVACLLERCSAGSSLCQRCILNCFLAGRHHHSDFLPDGLFGPASHERQG